MLRLFDFGNDVLHEMPISIPRIVTALRAKPEHPGKEVVGRRFVIDSLDLLIDATSRYHHDIVVLGPVGIKVALKPTTVAHNTSPIQETL